MLETDVLRSTLEHALRHGGDFAEVFVEDRRSSSARFDDGRAEELVSGRERGAGIRVVRGDTTGFAHTADLSPDGLRTRGRGRGGRGPQRRRPARASSSSTPQAANRPAETTVLPETVEKRRKVDLLAARRRRGPRRERGDHAR